MCSSALKLVLKDDLSDDLIFEDLEAITGKKMKDWKKQKKITKSLRVIRNEKHKYYRKPGKKHNNDQCFCCNEEGNLICCDGCPNSFHLLCLDPPMDDDDIPEGDWFCSDCQQSKVKQKQVIRKKMGRLFFARKKKKPSPTLKNLQKAIRILKDYFIESNPAEYEHPKSLQIVPFCFPGERKDSKAKRKHLASTKCFDCGKGADRQPMVGCDYCERWYHLDCPSLPLISVPRSLWMCENHIEYLVEHFLYKDIALPLTQRIAIWKACNEPIAKDKTTLSKYRYLKNIESEKINFHKAFTTKQPSKKLKRKTKKQIKQISQIHQVGKQSRKAIGKEKLEWLVSMAQFQSDVAKLVRKNAKIKSSLKKETLNKEKCKNLNALVPTFKACNKNNTSDMTSANLNEQKAECSIKKRSDEYTKAITLLAPEVIEVFAYQRLCQIWAADNPSCHLLKALDSPENCQACEIPSEKLHNFVINHNLSTVSEYNNIPYDEFEKFVTKELQGMNIVIGDSEESECDTLDFENCVQNSVPENTSNLIDESLMVSTNQMDAVLVSVPKGHMYIIKKRGCSIGKGSDVDVDLSHAGHCNFISDHHAELIFDFESKMWEVINYSPFGVVVDDVRISLDIRKLPTLEDSISKKCHIISNTKKVIYQYAKNLQSTKLFTFDMELQQKYNESPCGCSVNEILSRFEPGWNNFSANMSHGTSLKFGCLKLIVVEFTKNPI